MPFQRDIIDLRSDTVTAPTPSMRDAMAKASVGDDARGEDPTVNQLESEAAARLGKDSALFLPSGTMSNLVALLAVCGQGGRAIVGDKSHVLRVEQGISRIAGVALSKVENLPDGSVDMDSVREIVRTARPEPTVLVLENTHSYCGGIALPLDTCKRLGKTAGTLGLRVHVDGARIFNAAIAARVPAARLVESAHSVSFCLSKGLSAPAGSLLGGTTDFIRRAREFRQLLGGTMRQTGILAAAGLVALNSMVKRLPEDHEQAERLRQGLECLGLSTQRCEMLTNMVYVTQTNALAFQALLSQHGVLVSVLAPDLCRFVTHVDIDSSAIDEALRRIKIATASRKLQAKRCRAWR